MTHRLRAAAALAVVLLALPSLRAAETPAANEPFLAAYGAGYVKLQAKDYAGAQGDFTAAAAVAARNGEKGPALVRLGQCLEGQEKWAEAVAAYLQAADCPREDKPADQLRQQRHIADALKRTAEIQQRRLKDRAGERATLRRYFAFADPSPNERASWHQRLADSFAADQAWADGRAELDAALKLDGIDTNRVCELRTALAELWRRDNQPEQALAELARAAGVAGAAPQRLVDARLRSAELLLNPLTRIPDAQAAFAAVLDAAAAQPAQRLQAAIRLGETCQQAKDFAAARDAFAKALAIADAPAQRRADAQYKIGECWLAENKTAEARAAFTAFVALPDANPNQVKAAQQQLARLQPAEAPKP